MMTGQNIKILGLVFLVLLISCTEDDPIVQTESEPNNCIIDQALIEEMRERALPFISEYEGILTCPDTSYLDINVDISDDFKIINEDNLFVSVSNIGSVNNSGVEIIKGLGMGARTMQGNNFSSLYKQEEYQFIDGNLNNDSLYFNISNTVILGIDTCYFKGIRI